MRARARWSGLAVEGLLAVGCGKTASRTANADLQRDLKLAATANLALATQSQSTKYALVENAPKAQPNDAHVLRKGAGPKAIRSNTPTVSAAPEPTTAPAELPPLEMTSTVETPTPAPTPTFGTPASVSTAALPAPVPSGAVQPESNPQYGGGSPGVVIRGGRPGGDNCGPPRPGGSGIPGAGIPIFIPPPFFGGMGGGMGAPSGPPASGAPRAHGGRGGM